MIIILVQTFGVDLFSPSHSSQEWPQTNHEDNLNGRNKTKSKKEAEDASDGSNECHLRYFFFCHVERDVRVLDEDLNFGKILLGVPENFLAKS